MKFVEIIKPLMEGKKVKRKDTVLEYVPTRDSYGIRTEGHFLTKVGGRPVQLSAYEAIEADDWEIVSEPQPVKTETVIDDGREEGVEVKPAEETEEPTPVIGYGSPDSRNNVRKKH
jgi:hypothetical protein